MAHFAELDDFGTVTRVLVVADADCRDEAGVESEAVGTAFLRDLLGGRWVQTSYNARIRKNYAGIGYRYDASRDAFVPPRPYPSWTLDAATCQWLPPLPQPTTGYHVWVEALGAWVEVP